LAPLDKRAPHPLGTEGGNHDTPFAAAFLARNLPQLAIDGTDDDDDDPPNRAPAELLSYWSFSDVFEEVIPSDLRRAFHDGYGLLTKDGIPKPSYRAMQLLRSLGDTTIAAETTKATTGSASRGSSSRCLDSVTVVATTTASVDSDGAMRVLLSNFDDPPRLAALLQSGGGGGGGGGRGGGGGGGGGGGECTIRVTVRNLPVVEVETTIANRTSASASLVRVDGFHGNAIASWNAMGQPATLNPEQLQELNTASELTSELIPLDEERGIDDGDNRTASFVITIPMLGIAVVSF
jgi:hypothetical protein